MSNKLLNKGFSLTEVMMAAGILAIGFAFIAGMFPVGVKLTAITTEQTIAPIVADEAIAKIKLYADPNFVEALWQAQLSSPSEYIDFADLMLRRRFPINEDEFTYPSANIKDKRYYWSALCRRIGLRDVHLIIFVSRKAGAAAQYLMHDSDYTSTDYGQANPDVYKWPVPVNMDAEIRNNKQKLIIDATSNEKSYISTTSTIVDDATGWLYRVIERKLKDDDIIITLDRSWKWQQPVMLPVNVSVWVVPPAVGSGRNPCVKVDPTNTIRF